MENKFLHTIDLYVIIANYGQANTIVRYAKQLGFTGATVFYGMGTVRVSKLFEFLDLTTIKKEIIFMLAETIKGEIALKQVSEKFKFDKPNKGIAFSVPIHQVIGSRLFPEENPNKGVEEPMYQAVFTIVDKGKAHLVIDASKAAGSRGGTIINARGSGIHETVKLFNMEVLPEKEIVLVLCETQLTEGIVNSISQALEIEKPGNGIVFVQDVNQTFGLQKGLNI